MARPTTVLLVFFLAFNLFAGVLVAEGVDEAIGIDASVGEDDEYDEISGKEEVEAGTPRGDNLFGMYNVVTNQVKNIFTAIFPGLNMMDRAGVPGYITGGILGPIFSVVIIIEVISFLRGWQL
jgi:hypothetical protein